jgi:hypothetical protein
MLVKAVNPEDNFELWLAQNRTYTDVLLLQAVL